MEFIIDVSLHIDQARFAQPDQQSVENGGKSWRKASAYSGGFERQSRQREH
jgi:hypothetical protein